MESPAFSDWMTCFKNPSEYDSEMTRNSTGRQFRRADTATLRLDRESKFTQMSACFLGGRSSTSHVC